MLNLLPLLLAKAGAATLTTKVVVAGALSAATIGAAGATGVVPVDDLLPGDTSTVVVEDDTTGEVPVEEPTTPETEVTDGGEVDAPDEPALERKEAPEEDAGTSALEALDAAQSKAPEQADAGLNRARAAVTGDGERGPAAAGTAREQAARPTQSAPEQAQRPTARADRAPGAGSADQAPERQPAAGGGRD